MHLHLSAVQAGMYAIKYSSRSPPFAFFTASRFHTYLFSPESGFQLAMNRMELLWYLSFIISGHSSLPSTCRCEFIRTFAEQCKQFSKKSLSGRDEEWERDGVKINSPALDWWWRPFIISLQVDKESWKSIAWLSLGPIHFNTASLTRSVNLDSPRNGFKVHG